MPQLKETFTPADVARLLNCSKDHVRDLIASGDIVASNIGRGKVKARWVITETELTNFLSRRSNAQKRTRQRKRTVQSQPRIRDWV